MIKQKSLHASMITIIAIMGFISAGLVAISENIFRNLVQESEHAALVDLVDLEVAELLDEHFEKTKKLGLSVQLDKNLRTAIKNRDAKLLNKLLNNQFHQYFVTAGIIKLNKMYVIDREYKYLSESTENFIDVQRAEIPCYPTLLKAKKRIGSKALKPLSSLCYTNSHSNFVTIVPVGGLRPIAHLLILTDIALDMRQIDKALGMPVKLHYFDDTLAFQSEKWPSSVNSDNHVRISHKLYGPDNNAVFKISVAHNVTPFQEKWTTVGIVVITVSLIMIIIAIVVSSLILRKGLNPLHQLQEAAKQLSEGNIINIPTTTYPEIDIPIQSFNEMAHKITKLIRDLESEILDRKSAENELTLYRDHLEDIIEERTADVAIARDQAMAANHSKSAFLANMSHEIRTPLTAIIGFAETLLDNESGLLSREDATNTIIRSGRHLLQIINDILDLSKIEADKLEIEKIPIDLFSLIEEIKPLANIQAESKSLTFEIEPIFPLPTEIHSDPVRVKQILFNLIGNAIKFTDKGSVRVQIRYLQRLDQLCFKIIDTGIGLSQEQQNKLFKPFSQADLSTTRKYGGTGLGLYLSHSLVEKLGGNIDVTSKKDEGSIFTFSLLIGTIDNLNMTDRAPNAADKSIKKAVIRDKITCTGSVLVVDDNPDNQLLISLYLRKLGATVSTADNGAEAVEKVLANGYDLVLMDMQMPVMNGVEATKLLREKNYMAPIVALTANAMKKDIDQCLAAGSNSYLSKPVEIQAFNKTVASYLNEKPIFEYKKDIDIEGPAIAEIIKVDPKFAELVNIFIEDLPNYIQSIYNSQANSDWVAMKKMVLKLKVSAGSYGFPQIAELSRTIEIKIIENQFGDIETYVEELKSITDSVISSSRFGAAQNG